MADTWEVISGYSATDYVDTMTFEVDAETKKLAKLSGQTLVAGEKNSQYIQIKMPRYWDGIDISEMNIGIIYDLNNSEYFGTTQAISAERTTDSIRFGWVVPEDACAVKGTLLFVIIVKGTDYILKTQIAETPVVKSLSEDGDIPEPTKETWYADFQVRIERTLSTAENAVEEAQSVLEQARSFVGSPLVAETAAGMVDTDRIYVYTGSETGYTSGNWYYYNTGTSAWTSGGVYNAVAVDTDTTLTIAGKPADSKKTGDEISQIKEDFNDLINSAHVTDSASGSVAHFVDGADNVPMKSIKVNIAPVQSGSGDPSPDNVRPITGWNSVKVTRAGKNILSFPNDDYKVRSIVKNGVTFTVDSVGKITLNGTAGSAGNYSAQLVCGVYDGDDIVGCILNGCPSDGGNTKYRIIVQENASPWETYVTDFGDGAIVPETVIGKKVRVVVQVRQGYTVDNLVFMPMIRHISDTDDTYEPYNSNTYTISLSSAGTVYGGSLDVLSGKLTVYPYYASYNGETLTGGWISDRDVYAVGTTPTIGAQVVNVGAEGTEYQLEPHEVASLLGINNIWADTGDTSAEYRADTKLYIEKLTQPEEDDMIADSAITSGQFFMIGNSLYRALANIASGATITVGTNAQRVSLSDALNLVNA